MIKHINHQNVSTTPFVASKTRVLSNIQNSDTVILEPSGYTDGTNVSLDYVDYNSGIPIVNRECDIALEQQDFDSLNYEEGITGSAKFNPLTDPQNSDGTYKSLVHRTVKNAFYNTYRNPTEIFGVEHIDFPLSNTLRNLSDKFRIFNIPQLVFGDKIKPKSIHFYDNLFDDNVEIFDDGYQNLIAGYNLFSKVQEVRTLPTGEGSQNEILFGTASVDCPIAGQILFISQPQNQVVYLGFTASFSVTASSNTTPLYYQWVSGSTLLTDTDRITGSNDARLQINNSQVSDSGSYYVIVTNFVDTATSNTASLTVLDNITFITGSDSASLDVGLRFGSMQNGSPFVDGAIPIIGTSLLSGLIIDTVLVTYGGHDTSSVSIGFDSGNNFDTLLFLSNLNDTSSVSMGFDTGLLFDAVVSMSFMNDTSSLSMGFETGSIAVVVTSTSGQDLTATLGVSLISGSVQ
jgi:hypothetical protein